MSPLGPSPAHSIWNRTRSKAEPLAAKGGKVVDKLADLAGVDVLFSTHGLRWLAFVALTPATLVGMVEGTLIFVAYTERGERVRTISARRATKYEQDDYFQENGQAP